MKIKHTLPMQYVIDTVHAKDPYYFNPIHDDVLFSACNILEVEEGKRGWIGYEMYDADPGRMHRLHTSIVIKVTNEEDGSIEIETEYTIYHLTPIDKYNNEH